MIIWSASLAQTKLQNGCDWDGIHKRGVLKGPVPSSYSHRAEVWLGAIIKETICSWKSVEAQVLWKFLPFKPLGQFFFSKFRRRPVTPVLINQVKLYWYGYYAIPNNEGTLKTKDKLPCLLCLLQFLSETAQVWLYFYSL